MRLVLASNNPGKLRELRQLLAGDRGLELEPQGELGVPEAVESGQSFLENALIKARHAAAHTGLAALADDSGIVVDALGGAPGVHSARYAGEGAGDAENLRKLAGEIASLPDDRRAAHFVCVLACLRVPDDPMPLIAEGVWDGLVLSVGRGENGFGYDPLFFLPEHGRTSAELTAQQKNLLSHRAQALRKLVAGLPRLRARCNKETLRNA